MKMKMMLTVFLTSAEFCITKHAEQTEGQTVNNHHYLEVLHHLHDAVWHKKPDLRES